MYIWIMVFECDLFYASWLNLKFNWSIILGFFWQIENLGVFIRNSIRGISNLIELSLQKLPLQVPYNELF